MNDRDPQSNIRASGDLRQWARHPSDEQLNALADGSASGAEATELRAHLASCDTCARLYDELSAVRTLLQGLPTPLPRRSFQLPVDAIRSGGSLWDRIGVRLLPAMPALRAATIAIALLLVASIAGDLLSEPDSTGFIAEESAPAVMTQLPGTLPTTTVVARENSEPTDDEAALRTNTAMIDGDDAAGQSDSAAPVREDGDGDRDAAVQSEEAEALPDGQGAAARTGSAAEADDTESAPAADSALAESAPAGGQGVENDATLDESEAAGASAPSTVGDASDAEEAGASEDAPLAASVPEEEPSEPHQVTAAFADDAVATEVAAGPASDATTSPDATPAALPAPAATLDATPALVDSMTTSGSPTSNDSMWWRSAQIAFAVLLSVTVVALLLAQRVRPMRG